MILLLCVIIISFIIMCINMFMERKIYSFNSCSFNFIDIMNN